MLQSETNILVGGEIMLIFTTQTADVLSYSYEKPCDETSVIRKPPAVRRASGHALRIVSACPDYTSDAKYGCEARGGRPVGRE